MQGSSVVIDHFVKSGKIVFSKRIEKFIFYEFSNLERIQKQIFQVTKKNTIHDNITMHFIGGRGRVGFVKELKVVNSNKE